VRYGIGYNDCQSAFHTTKYSPRSVQYRVVCRVIYGIVWYSVCIVSHHENKFTFSSPSSFLSQGQTMIRLPLNPQSTYPLLVLTCTLYSSLFLTNNPPLKSGVVNYIFTRGGWLITVACVGGVIYR